MAPVAERLTELGREMAELSRQLRSAGPAGPVERDVLFRLATGQPGPHDLSALTVPLSGSRLLVARTCQARLLADLRPVGPARSFHGCVIPHVGVMLLVAGRIEQADPKAARAVASGVLRLDPDAGVGISSVIAGPADIPAAYRTAAELAELAGPTPGRALVADDCWTTLTLHRLVPLVAEALPAVNPIERLRSYDEKRRSDLTTSVYTWIMCNGDNAAAAARLFVHPNTLRYRLQRAEQISGLDLGDADERMLFQLGVMTSRGMQRTDHSLPERRENRMDPTA